ncbi:hypothetical protein LJK87_26085 [Paenibacillus sp. P25]|nr:hypothetical protein LJK87_26085 [Paenibacillus sp. P25]
MTSRPSFIRRYLLFVAVYATAIGIYLWYASGHAVPEAYKGTAADPATFLTPQRLAQSQTYSAAGNLLFFLSFPWEWGSI